MLEEKQTTMLKSYKTSTEGIQERKALIRKEVQRKLQLKKNLKKLYREVGIEEESSNSHGSASNVGGEMESSGKTAGLVTEAKEKGKGGRNKGADQKSTKVKFHKKRSPFKKAADSIEQKREQKLKLVEERKRIMEERETKKVRSKIERRDTHINLSKRTKKGQPVMANAINHVLAKLLSK